MGKYDVVLFDVDGTLLDSAPGIIHTIEETLQIMGVDYYGTDLRKYLGPPLRKTYADFFQTESEIEEAVRLYRKSYAVRGSHECIPYPGVYDMLHDLKKAGIRIFTATSKPTQVVEPILNEHDMARYFEAVVGASLDTERDTKTDVIRYVLRSYGLQNRKVLMVGDRMDDMKGAADCGIDAAGVVYGYGSVEEISPFHPVFYAASCKELTEYILQ